MSEQDDPDLIEQAPRQFSLGIVPGIDRRTLPPRRQPPRHCLPVLPDHRRASPLNTRCLGTGDEQVRRGAVVEVDAVPVPADRDVLAGPADGDAGVGPQAGAVQQGEQGSVRLE
jgi:hypothetical protein